MVATAIPVLGGKNFVTDPVEKFTIAIGHALASDNSQSREYRGQVTSIQGLVSKYGHAPNDMAAELQTALTRYLSRFYTVAEVACTVPPDTLEADGRYKLNVDATVREGDAVLTLGSILLVNPNEMAAHILEAMNR